MGYYPLKSYCNTDVRIAGTSTKNALLILQLGHLIKQRDNYKHTCYCSYEVYPNSNWVPYYTTTVYCCR